MRRGGYKFRTLQMNLQLRDKQLKTTSYTYRLISKLQNNCKPKIYNGYTNTMINIGINPEEERTRDEGKTQEQTKQIQSN